MSTWHLPRHRREQLAAWLPVLLMALFALGSWWLVRSAPQFAQPNAAAPVSHKPDYRMWNFSVQNFNPEGQLTSEIKGDEGLHFPDTDTLEVHEPRVRAYDEQGHLTVGQAERGFSNSDGSVVKLYDEANIVREPVMGTGGKVIAPRLEFRGNYLEALPKEERYSSDQPVDLLRGRDQFSGDRFDYDNKSGIANLQGNVHGIIQPAAKQ